MQEPGPLIGILGGMGPLATADFTTQLVTLAGATCDQDHVRSVVYSNPRMPDRSCAIMGQGPSPLPDLLTGVAFLERCGAHVIAIPCNTAHHWIADVVRATAVPVLSIVDAVGDELSRRPLASTRIGILGTEGLIRSGVYRQVLGPRGFDVVDPSDGELETLIQPAIRAVKAGHIERARTSLGVALRSLEDRGVAAVVLGCTEIPLALTAASSSKGTPLIDSTRCLALGCLDWASAFETRAAALRRVRPLTPAQAREWPVASAVFGNAAGTDGCRTQHRTGVN